MHSLEEIKFRLQQELWNLTAFLHPPKLRENTSPSRRAATGFAQPEVAAERLKGSSCAREICDLADGILRHELPLFGGRIQTGPSIDWGRDYIHGQTNPIAYIRRIPYLDFDRAGDHKVIWELSRHQHLIVLAQAFCLTGRTAYLEELWRQLDHWIVSNPLLQGINWTSALEVAFRALSWIWVDHLAGSHMPDALKKRFRQSLFQHGAYLERNLSVYFSPNTHLLGEAVALHAIGVLYPEFPNARRWRTLADDCVKREIEIQIRPDGVYFEQSTYYHVYAMDFFLFHSLLTEVNDTYRTKLIQMAEFLHAAMGPARKLPFFGDDDGGRLFHPYGDRSQFGRATLATFGILLNRPEWIGAQEDLHPQAAWWLSSLPSVPVGASASNDRSRLFPESGFAVLSAGSTHVVSKVGPFGPWSGGHSHSDVLSVTTTVDEEEILIDPATYTYVSNKEQRNWFRGSSAHNTVRIDGLSQATPAGPFSWSDKPQTRILGWHSDATYDLLDAECAYSGFRHRRRLLFYKPWVVVAVDDITAGDQASHRIDQLWHFAKRPQQLAERFFRIGSRAVMLFPEPVEVREEQGWRSTVLGSKQEAPVLVASCDQHLPVVLTAVLDLSGDLINPSVSTVSHTSTGITISIANQHFLFSNTGDVVLANRPNSFSSV